MPFPLTPYNKTLTGITAGQEVLSGHQIINYGDIETCVDSFYNAIDDLQKFQDAYESVDGVRRLTVGSFVGGTNQLDIAANAIVVWDSSAEVEVSGWGSKTLSSLTSSNSFYIWATYVSGTPDYEATGVGAALPSNLSEKYFVGVAVVDGAGAVTFASTLSTAFQNRANFYREKQTFLNGIDAKGAITGLSSTNYHDVRIEYASASTLKILANSLCKNSADTDDIKFTSDVTISTGTLAAINGIAQSANLTGTIYTSNKVASVVTFTDAGDIVNLAAHGLVDGTPVFFTNSGGALPTGLTASTVYFIKSTGAGTFTLYPTVADALAGTSQVTFTGTGSGTNTANFNCVGGTATTTFSTDFIVNDVITTAAGQSRRITAVNNNTAMILESVWTSTETNVTYKRGGKAPNTTYYLYACKGGSGVGGLLSTRNVLGGEALVDLVTGYDTSTRQIKIALRLNASSNLDPISSLEGYSEKILIQQQIALNVASVNFTTGINASFNRYLLEWQNVQPATDQTVLCLQVSTNGGSSYDAGASDYSNAYILPGVVSSQTTNNCIIFNVHSIAAGLVGNASNEGTSGEIIMYNPSNAAISTTFAGHSTWMDSASNTQNAFIGGGRKAIQDTDALKLSFSSSNIASGTFRLYGLR